MVASEIDQYVVVLTSERLCDRRDQSSWLRLVHARRKYIPHRRESHLERGVDMIEKGDDTWISICQ